jgi:thiamine biosynthesis lipoprotein
VRLPVGVRLDLGGIAKGHAADQLVELLLADGATGACVNIGGDVRVEGDGPNGGPWAIALDLGPDVADAPRVLLGAGSVCTSSRHRRVWRAGSEPVHHLIDPRNGRSVDQGLASISVIGRYAAQAEVLTKAVFVAGPDVGTKLLEELGVAAVLVRDDGELLEVGNVRELAG